MAGGGLVEGVKKLVKSGAAKNPPVKAAGTSVRKLMAAERLADAEIFARAQLIELLERVGKMSSRVLVGEAAVGAMFSLAPMLAKQGLKLSDIDFAHCLGRLLRLNTSDGGDRFFHFITRAMKGGALARRQGYISAFSGELRERAIQYLDNVAVKLDQYYDDAVAAAKASGHPSAAPFDSAKLGEVRMPTSSLRGTAPVLDMLGPDRIFGVIIPYAKKSAEGFVGEIHATRLVEIKSVTGAHGGINQAQKFFARGAHGEVTINGEVYKLVFDEQKLGRTVVFPANATGRRSVEAFAKKEGIETIAYSAAAEKKIAKASAEIVDGLIVLQDQLAKTAKVAAQKAGKAKP